MEPKNFGETLRKARIIKKLSVSEVSDTLISSGYPRASVKTIYGWESGHSQPSPDYFLRLCDIYEIDDILETFGYKNELRATSDATHADEFKPIQKYRTLDEYGKKAVDAALEVQVERMNSKPDLSAMSEDEILAEMERRETRRLGAAAKGGKSMSILLTDEQLRKFEDKH